MALWRTSDSQRSDRGGQGLPGQSPQRQLQRVAYLPRVRVGQRSDAQAAERLEDRVQEHQESQSPANRAVRW